MRGQLSLLLAQTLFNAPQRIGDTCLIRDAQSPPAPADLRQPEDLSPDKLIRIVLEHWPLRPQRAAQMPISIRADARIVTEFS